MKEFAENIIRDVAIKEQVEDGEIDYIEYSKDRTKEAFDIFVCKFEEGRFFYIDKDGFTIRLQSESINRFITKFDLRRMVSEYLDISMGSVKIVDECIRINVDVLNLVK